MSLLRLGYKDYGFHLPSNVPSFALRETNCHTVNCPMEKTTEQKTEVSQPIASEDLRTVHSHRANVGVDPPLLEP